MLIRFNIQNFYSFGEMREFNMLAAPNQKRLAHHEQEINAIKLMKMAAIYGANGAGKSNLVKGLALLQGIVQREEVSPGLKEKAFKFFSPEENKTQVLSVEFIHKEQAFYYAMELRDGVIETEELYLSRLEKEEDQLVFERKTTDGKITYRFLDEFEKDPQSQLLKKVIEDNLIKPNKVSLKLLVGLNNPFLKNVEVALEWFTDMLQIIGPNFKPHAMAHLFDKVPELKKYASDLMCTTDIGICGIEVIKKDAKGYPGEIGEEMQELLRRVEANPGIPIIARASNGEELIFIKEDDDLVVKGMTLKHEVSSGKSKLFRQNEESDGTLRLLEFTFAFYDLMNSEKVFIIDEIERSIHPLLIKELLQKFSSDEKTIGQLIFTTHESNLLDQDIFRRDEIWFVEKDKDGSSDLYPLSDFEVHSTIDIQKGYLAGRFGAIPFLGNLKDLNWHKHDHSEKAL